MMARTRTKQVADPAALSIIYDLLASVAEEMGVTLGRTAHSPNIKERRDYSCAVFDRHGRMVAQAAHMPVHLGAMPFAVRAAEHLAPFRPGDMIILNDPYLGGTHLPDISLISPVFYPAVGSGQSAIGGKSDEPQLIGFVTNRAHHADVGGMSPGSMPVARELYQEGVIIPPLRLYAGGVRNEELFELMLRNMRVPEQRRGDFDAQIAAQRTGERRLIDLAERYGPDALQHNMTALMDYAERITRSALRALPDGEYEFEDAMDDDGEGSGPLRLKVRVTLRDGSMHCDFTGTDPARPSSVNAVASVTRSAVYYVVRCLLEEHTPSNDGCFRPVSFHIPEGCLLNAQPPLAVSAGNVETSQRITDLMLGAMAQACPDRIPAASSGTMNNLTIGGFDPRHDRHYTYYETICGGAGGGPRGAGLSGVHTHMTNTLNTPVEALELAFPFRIEEYGLRPHTGGEGRQPGGDGAVRRYRFLAPATVTIVSERRILRPWGLNGGMPATAGENILIHADGTRERLPGKTSFKVSEDEVVEIRTPGGGGWGHR
ncbi:MAG: hydantoinase B/oxoprolinase family protein [Dehalococcoidia bacterium]